MQIEKYVIRSFEESGCSLDDLADAFRRLETLLPDGSTSQRELDVRAYSEKLVTLGIVDLVLAPDGCIVGINGYYANDKETRIAYCSILLLSPEVSTKAAIIIRRCFRTAKEQGMRALRLRVLKSNTQAIRLYERVGFAICGEHGERYEMSKELD